MSTTPCPGCQEEINTTNQICPYCGAEISQESSIKESLESIKRDTFEGIEAFLILGIVLLCLAIPLIQFVLYLRFGVWYEADGFLALGLFKLYLNDTPITISNAMQMREHYATMDFGWTWVGIEKITKWVLDFHLTILILVLAWIGFTALKED